MPWTKSSPPDVAKNKPAEQIEACVLAANRTLERGGTEEEAIFACVGAMKAVSKSVSKPVVKQEKKLPSHFPTAEMFKALREEQKEEVKKALVLPAFLSKHSLPEGVERNVIAINFDKVGKLVVAFDTGEIITTDAVAVKEIVEQHIGVSVEGGIKEIVAGDGITVDNTDPKRPIVSSTGSGTGSGIAGDSPVFIQETMPTYVGRYLWVQTNIDGDPNNFTFWIEDGI